MIYYTYLLECADGSYYCGYTTDVKRRTKTHSLGKGAKYTRSRLPVRLVYFEEYSDKRSALCRECAIKRLSHEEKKKMALEFAPISD